MNNKHLSTMLLNEIEDKLKDLYTGSEIIRLTNNYAEGNIGTKYCRPWL